MNKRKNSRSILFTSGFCYSLDTFLKAVHLFRLDNALFLCYTLLRDLAEAGHRGLLWVQIFMDIKASWAFFPFKVLESLSADYSEDRVLLVV